MKTLLTFTCALSALLLAETTARAEKAACTASVEVGKKYHWVSYVGGKPDKSGYIKFTNKKFGKWSKVRHLTDRPKSKKWFWGFFDQTKITFKNKAVGERWTAWMKYCDGARIKGNVYKGGKIVYQFEIDTSKTRD